MKTIMFFITTAFIMLFVISCGDSNTVTHNNCSNSCDKTWQTCNEKTQKCEPKEGFCANNDDCKDNDGASVCNEETHKCSQDKCALNPCRDNENGAIVCKLADNEDGYECICQEGYELKDDVCVEKEDPCKDNPCQDNEDGKTICKVDENADNGYICISEDEDKCTPNPCENNENGATLCKLTDNEDGYECTCQEGYELKDDVCVEINDPCNPNPCENNDEGKFVCKPDEEAENGYVCEKPDCDATRVCENLGETKCVDNKVLKCIQDTQTYCTVWTEENDCGVGECIAPEDGNEAYCTCQECNPDEFTPACSEDYKSFQYCDNTDGCFTIKTVTCEGATHCGDENEDGNLECIQNDCTDDPQCSSEDDKLCATSGGASILRGCKINDEGCLELYTITDCTLNNMTCQEYNNENQCIGGAGTKKCENGNNNDNEIKMNGIWHSSTNGMDDDYSGCSGDNFDGKDAVYSIRVESGATLNLTVKNLNDGGTVNHVSPAIYVMKANCNSETFCQSSISGNSGEGAVTSLSLTNLEAGKYNIIIDSNSAGMMVDVVDSFEYELTVNLQ